MTVRGTPEDNSEQELAEQILDLAFVAHPHAEDSLPLLQELLSRTALETVDSLVRDVPARLAGSQNMRSKLVGGLNSIRDAAVSSGEQLLVDIVCLSGMRTLVDEVDEYDEAVSWGVGCIDPISESKRHLVYGDLAIASTFLRHAVDAVEYAEIALHEAESQGEEYWVARYHGLIATALARDGRFAEALAEYDQAIGLGRLLSEFDVLEKYRADRELVAAALAEEHDSEHGS